MAAVQGEEVKKSWDKTRGHAESHQRIRTIRKAEKLKNLRKNWHDSSRGDFNVMLSAEIHADVAS